MSPFRAIFTARFRTALQYRAAALAGLGTQIAFGFIIVGCYEAFYRGGSAPAEFGLSKAAGYLWLGQAFLALLPWNLDPLVKDLVRSGEIGKELLKPVDLFASWVLGALAYRGAQALLRCLPVVLFALLALPALGMGALSMKPPADPTSLAAFVLAMPGAALLGAVLTAVYGVILVRTISAAGLVAVIASVVMVCSGMLVPLQLFPDALRGILELLPFAFLVDAPFRFWVGSAEPGRIAFVLAGQAFWIAALAAGGRLWLGHELRRLAVAGG